jgi:hypothetical protein
LWSQYIADHNANDHYDHNDHDHTDDHTDDPNYNYTDNNDTNNNTNNDQHNAFVQHSRYDYRERFVLRQDWLWENGRQV